MKRYHQTYLRYVCLLIVLTIFMSGLREELYQMTAYHWIKISDVNSDRFRKQDMEEEGYQKLCSMQKKEHMKFSEILSVFSCTADFQITKNIRADKRTYENQRKRLEQYCKEEYAYYQEIYEMLYGEAKYFPVASLTAHPEYTVSFENSWMYERTYGGKRGHEGTDIMASVNERGRYPIVSMTDGTVEQIGWLPKGGYRIGIRSPKGVYYYYAHLERYADHYTKGDKVQAGDLLGFMGDTGYSEVEGTTGNFPVHLHLGIYLAVNQNKELSVNPYWILRQAEADTLCYDGGVTQ